LTCWGSGSSSVIDDKGIIKPFYTKIKYKMTNVRISLYLVYMQFSK